MKKIKPTFKLTKEEKEMDKATSWNSIRPLLLSQKKQLQTVARNTTSKNKVITVRLSERNLIHLKAAAAREGVPYQTFVSALIQKHT